MRKFEMEKRWNEKEGKVKKKCGRERKTNENGSVRMK